MKQCDPSVLHDNVEAMEGESGVDEAEWADCDEASKSMLYRGEGAASPSHCHQLQRCQQLQGRLALTLPLTLR